MGVALLLLSALSSLARAPLESRVAELSTGLRMEWLRQPAASPSARHVLLVHGSVHGAWCWAEHWMGYLSDRGFTAHAVSLRGTSGSPAPEGTMKVFAEQHVNDLRAFVEDHLMSTGEPPPTLVGHSFGGAFLYEYLARGHPAAAAAFLCPVPPSGNMAMVGRFLRRSPGVALLVTKGLAFKTVTRSSKDARAVFFDDTLPESDVQRYVERFAADSLVSLDLRDFTRNLPSRSSGDDGRAKWLACAPPCLVMGASEDKVVDVEGLQEAAYFLGVEPPIVCHGLPHDVMLATKWEIPAARLVEWLHKHE